MAQNFLITLTPDDFVPGSTHPDRIFIQNMPLWSFDHTTVEHIISRSFEWPAAYTGQGTLKAKLFLFCQTDTSGKVDFEVSVQAITPGDSFSVITGESFDTANAGNVTVAGTNGHVFTLTITLTNADNVAAGDIVKIKIERDADDGTDDTANSGDCRLIAVSIYEER